MQTRTWSSGTYRFGFNGKEKDDEINVDGGSYDYGMRIYDTRLARFLSVDPIGDSYPYYTSYQFAGNRPIWCVDIDGLEDIPTNGGNYYSIESLKEEAMQQLRVKEAIKAGNRVLLHQNYSVNGNHIKRIIILNEGTPGLQTVGWTQEGSFGPDGTLGSMTQSYLEEGIYNPTPTPAVPDPTIGPETPPNPPVETGDPTVTPPIDGEGVPKKEKHAKLKPGKPIKSKQIDLPKPAPIGPKNTTSNNTKKDVPPAAPNPDKLCFICFNGATAHYTDGVTEIVDWLKSNPDYNLRITADGGSSTLIKDTWKDTPFGSKTTYEKHTDAMFKRLKKAVNAAGGDSNRIIQTKGNADGSKLKYEAVKNGK